MNNHPTSGVTPAEWERRKEFAGFKTEDAQALVDMRPIAEHCVDEVVEKLYTQFFRFEETQEFFQDQTTLERVQALQIQYFLGLFGGGYGEEYLANRLQIGRVHQRIGLEPRWYMGAYSNYLRTLIPRLTASLRPEQVNGSLSALLKLITLDMELAISTYSAAQQEMVTRQQEEIIELQRRLLDTREPSKSQRPFRGRDLTGLGVQVVDDNQVNQSGTVFGEGQMDCEDPYRTLTSREREVLSLVAEGYTNAEIAARLGISSRTVETHRANLMRKLGLRTLAELIRYALRQGILSSDT